MGFRRKVGVFFGVCTDKKLIANLPRMCENDLRHQARLVKFRQGSALMGLLFNSLASVLCSAFLVPTLVNLRQLDVSAETKKRIRQALQDHVNGKGGDCGESARPIGHIKGTRRMFLFGVTVKLALLIFFLGHVGAEDAVLHWLDKLLAHVFDNVPYQEFVGLLPDVHNEHVQTVAVELGTMINNFSGEGAEEVVQKMHDFIHEFFDIPHRFNELPVMEVVSKIAEFPLDVARDLAGVPKVEPTPGEVVLAGFQPWSKRDGLGEVACNVVCGAAMELNVVAIGAEKIAEKFVKKT